MVVNCQQQRLAPRYERDSRVLQVDKKAEVCVCVSVLGRGGGSHGGLETLELYRQIEGAREDERRADGERGRDAAEGREG